MDPRAGTPAQPVDLIDVTAVVAQYYDVRPDPTNPAQRVSFGTSGHRGSSLKGSFNEDHIVAITQAVCDYRAEAGITGPMLLGYDTHVLSEPAFRTALGVLVANQVQVFGDEHHGFVPTPAMSHAILRLNGRGRSAQDAVAGGVDGLIVTPSHNPPADGGIKYNPPHGGPAGAEVTAVIADRANAYLEAGLQGCQRVVENEAFAALQGYDFRKHYVDELGDVVDMAAIAAAKVRIGADPLGGAAVAYWPVIAKQYGLDITVVNDAVDPAFGFMTLDHDGKIRMDCSSPYAMASLVARAGDFEVAIGNDADADRHGIVTPDGGLMNPNHFLAVAVDHLLRHRDQWPTTAPVGKTLVSSVIIDKVVAAHGRELMEVPVGFKWFVPGLLDGAVVFGGEESAGASMLRRDGTVWTTDKDGLVLGLLAAEVQAVSGQSPSARYAQLTADFGTAHYQRVDAPADARSKARLKELSAADVLATQLAGDAITVVTTQAPGNGAQIGGLKVATDRAWFAARPSGTEDIYKIYAESLVSAEHLVQVQAEAKALVDQVLRGD